MSEARRQWELLQKYALHGDQRAFAQVVSEHVDMVYSACLRQVGDRHLAEEVTQAVFVILARKAGTLGDHIVLAAWLHKTARYAALNALKIERRRRIHERKAAEMAMELRNNGPGWVGLEPVLDEGIARLAENDRAAIMLRFFEKRSMADVGSALGVSEDAAGMRISRALDKLRSFFSRRGVAVTSAVIGTLMLRNGVQAAPAGLQAAIAAHTSIVGSASIGLNSAPLVQGALRMMFWEKARVAAAVLVTMIMAGGGGTYLFHYLLTHDSPAPTPHHVHVNSEESSA
ncbi:MAG TPA: sigma-70 family RNA polymerase sigma factor [Tepidisphaeraceae bacterium]|jgi:RNA polymerase sigma factor (sigma-70 family)|nr:sigma-70 family RNA polymerase sigma factor [Tepidisphaeraceae bacterium]